MEQLIIQSGHKNDHISPLFRSDGEDITIGRAFTNHIVLSDQYVAGHQARIFSQPSEADQQSWFIEVLDDTNSVLLNGTPIKKQITPLHSKDRLVLGRTSLSVFSSDHQVEPTKILQRRNLHQDSFGWLMPMFIMSMVALLSASSEYALVQPLESWVDFTKETLLGAAVILIWASIWAVIGRIFRHQSHFGQQLQYTSLVMLGILIIDPFAYILEFNSNSLLLGYAISYTVAFVGLAVLLNYNLSFATNIHRTQLMATLISGVLIGVYGANHAYNADEFSPNPVYSQILTPPATKFAGDSTPDAYLQSLSGMVDEFDNHLPKSP
ncbi:FHA domain-containing protein [Litoribacillus peritrichatus]|uniref:FHA domain-containing protein n=1 Tax=Litoribacillus peritrichatus TaxID=718191 RepID=A0ABP7NDH4_9GAMM